LHATRVRAIAFENVDVILGTRPGIGFDAIQARLIGRDRGGHCYEHADGRVERHVVRRDQVDTALDSLHVVLTGEELDRLRLVLAESRS
jgi:hypothetical protein